MVKGRGLARLERVEASKGTSSGSRPELEVCNTPPPLPSSPCSSAASVVGNVDDEELDRELEQCRVRAATCGEAIVRRVCRVRSSGLQDAASLCLEHVTVSSLSCSTANQAVNGSLCP